MLAVINCVKLIRMYAMYRKRNCDVVAKKVSFSIVTLLGHKDFLTSSDDR